MYILCVCCVNVCFIIPFLVWRFVKLIYIWIFNIEVILKFCFEYNSLLRWVEFIISLRYIHLTCCFVHPFYTPVFRREILWYGDVRPSRSPSVRLFVRPGIAHSSFTVMKTILHIAIHRSQYLSLLYLLTSNNTQYIHIDNFGPFCKVSIGDKCRNYKGVNAFALT